MSTFSLYSKNFVRSILTILFLVLIVALSRNAWDLWNLADRVGETEGKLRKLAEEKERLEAEYKLKTSDFAIEKEIRDKLHLARPGETVVIMPGDQLLPTSYLLPDEFQDEKVGKEDKPNWLKWWEVVRGEE